MDLADLDRQALAWSGDVIAQVRPEQLDQPTPCGDWTLGELLGHMIAHNRGFAAALRDEPVGAGVWDSLRFDGDPHAAFDRSATALTAAFAGDGRPPKIEVYGYGSLSLTTVYRMHIVDFVVHGWDVARSIGLDRMPADELSAAAYQIMLGFPDNRPSPAFGVVVPVPADAPAGDRLMGYVGRDPDWRPAG